MEVIFGNHATDIPRDELIEALGNINDRHDEPLSTVWVAIDDNGEAFMYGAKPTYDKASGKFYSMKNRTDWEYIADGIMTNQMVTASGEPIWMTEIPADDIEV